jgi:crotonobetainyl-CoA:carnitine CoA-transferase CaiB-like acyl-CoA transferase
LATGITSLLDHTRDPFNERDAIKRDIATRLVEESTDYWLSRLRQYKLWVMPVLDWQQLKQEPAYQSLRMEQELLTSSGASLQAIRGAIHIDGQGLYSSKAAPLLGEHTEAIKQEFLL